MPHNATKIGPKKRKEILERFPEKIYADLNLEKQIACYKFWSFLATDGSQGWSPFHTPGSVKNYRLSREITKRIKQSSWPKVGKVCYHFDFFAYTRMMIHSHDVLLVSTNL